MMGTVVETIFQGLRLAGEMFWKVCWVLVLGFTIAGRVDTFVSEEKMSTVLGENGWQELDLLALFEAYRRRSNWPDDISSGVLA